MTSYNDGNIPAGGFVVTLLRGQTSPQNLGQYILESFTPERPSKAAMRGDQDGGPNGFKLVNAQETGNGVLQIATATVPYPQRGDYFLLTCDPAFPNEKWVIQQLSQPSAAGEYLKSNISVLKATF